MQYLLNNNKTLTMKYLLNKNKTLIVDKCSIWLQRRSTVATRGTNGYLDMTTKSVRSRGSVDIILPFRLLAVDDWIE